MSAVVPAFHPEFIEIKLPIWKEAIVVKELVALRASAVWRGQNLPAGNGAGVITIPGFMCSDQYTQYLTQWLQRVGYRGYASGLGQNNDCADKLVAVLLTTIAQAAAETNNKVHLIGHSLGGVLARIAATLRPDLVASVITLGSPFRGIRAHQYVLWLGQRVRDRVQSEQSPHCFTGFCACPAVAALHADFPATVRQTAIYTKSDGIVDWQACITEDAARNFAVTGTHSGLVFNAQVYRLIAETLAAYAEGAHG